MIERKDDRPLHEESKKKYHGLDLTDGEHVIINIKRHWIGRFQIWAGVVLGIIVLLAAAAFFFFADLKNVNFSDYLALICVLLALFTPFIGVVFIRDYDEDWMIVTNLRLINNTRHTVFASVIQDISLDKVEDVSASQVTIFEKMFDYGTVKMSTIGDEHTYKFTYVVSPLKQSKAVRRVIVDFHDKKDGRS